MREAAAWVFNILLVKVEHNQAFSCWDQNIVLSDCAGMEVFTPAPPRTSTLSTWWLLSTAPPGVRWHSKWKEKLMNGVDQGYPILFLDMYHPVGLHLFPLQAIEWLSNSVKTAPMLPILSLYY